MKETWCFILVFALLCGCDGNKKTDNIADVVKSEVVDRDSMVVDSIEVCDTIQANNTAKKSLNDIRFAGWTEKEWLDNEYIRTLRLYLNEFSKGRIENEMLEPYRKLTKGKFVVGQIEPFLLGGVFIYIMFIEEPEKVFAVTVYSEVDSETAEVGKHEVRSITYQTEVPGIPKELLQQMMQEHPEMKVW